MILHRPTIVRTLLLSAGLTLTLYAVVKVVAPAAVELSGDGATRGVVLVAGLLARLLAGRLAARAAWQADADIPLLLASTVVGGLLGWLLFPGLLSVVGLLADGSLSTLASLLLDLALWLVCVALGALSLQLGPAPRARA